MSDDQAQDQPEAGHDAERSETSTPVRAHEPVHTGLDRVDAVVRSVQGLEDRPVDEHVGIYEAAHTELRRTLDEAPAAADPDPDSR